MSSRDSNSLLELGASPTFRVSAAAAILCGAPGGSDARAAGVPTRLFRPPVGTARLWACMLRHASFRAQRRLRYRLLARAGMGAAVLSEQDRAFRAAAGQGPRLHLPNGGIAPNCALIAGDRRRCDGRGERPERRGGRRMIRRFRRELYELV